MVNPTFDAQLDAAMEAAYAQARETFREFWRELTWEYRRIVPALDFAVVKVPFSDPGPPEDAEVEVMWVEQPMFDGLRVTGVLLNEPNVLHSIKQGDQVDVPLGQVADWMYVQSGSVFGAWTVQLIRARMSTAERKEYDEAWGLEFPDPETVNLSGWGDAEHPMSANMASELLKMDDAKLAPLLMADPNGWTTLHSLALGGSAACVDALLRRGADPAQQLPDGRTALDLARTLNWSNVIQVLRLHGAA